MYAKTYTTIENLAKAIVEYLVKEGVIITKPAKGDKKKRITNLWYDEETGEVVIETEN